MNDLDLRREPGSIRGIVADTKAMSFEMISEPKVGALLAVLAASKPGGRLLELGTGTGHGTAWLLAGMDTDATLDTVDTDEDVVAVARQHLGADPGVRFHVQDGAEFLGSGGGGSFCCRKRTGPKGTPRRCRALIDDLEGRDGFATVRLAWASGLMLVVRRS